MPEIENNGVTQDYRWDYLGDNKWVKMNLDGSDYHDSEWVSDYSDRDIEDHIHHRPRYRVTVDQDYFTGRRYVGGSDARRDRREAARYIRDNSEEFGITGNPLNARNTEHFLTNKWTKEQADIIARLFPERSKQEHYTDLTRRSLHRPILRYSPPGNVRNGEFKAGTWYRGTKWVRDYNVPVHKSRTVNYNSSIVEAPDLIFPHEGYKMTMNTPDGKSDTVQFNPDMQRVPVPYEYKTGGSLNYFSYFQ